MVSLLSLQLLYEYKLSVLPAFARTNNLKVHEQSVHHGVRAHVCPFAGCQKAEKGFSRKHDLDVHIRRQHMINHGNMRGACS